MRETKYKFRKSRRPGHDQVPRKDRYEAKHPGVRFIPPCAHNPDWTAEIASNGLFKPLDHAPELRQLLDQLEDADDQPVVTPEV